MTGEKEPDDFTNHFMWDTDNSRRANELTLREMKRRRVCRVGSVRWKRSGTRIDKKSHWGTRC